MGVVPPEHPMPRTVPNRQLPHGCTNETWRDRQSVSKRYTGTDAARRLRTEVNAILTVQQSVPVPAVIEVIERDLTVVFAAVPGAHGQDLLKQQPEPVLASAGRVLRRLNDCHPGMVHGDYGAQNLLLDDRAFEVTAVLDWEFAHSGDPVEDPAWAEWIVRMHHPAARWHLDALFEGYGHQPAWAARHAAMLQRCRELSQLAGAWGDAGAQQLWDQRSDLTERWLE
jgi:tRNA A-37 threonylcarbamoyl transferase component Bud32